MPDSTDDQQQQTPVAPDPAQQPADQGQQPQSNLTQALTQSVQPPQQNPPQQPVQTTTSDTVPTSVDPQQQAEQNRDKALNFHPAVTAAHIARKVGEAISGGPQYQKVIDPETGEVTRKLIPPTTKSIILGSLANLLGGIGQVGQNFAASREGRAPAPPRPLPTQVEQQQRDQQSDQDFDRVQQTKVRQAKVIEANLNAMKAAYAFGKEDEETKKSVVANHASDLDQWQKSGAVEAQQIPSDQLLKKGFDTSKYIAVPDGVVPVMGADGQQAKSDKGTPLTQLTYAVVDGTTQTPLTQDKYDQFAKYGLMQAKDGFKLPEGATITGASLSMMNHKLDLINQTQKEIDAVAGAGKVDLAAEMRKNPAVLKAIGDFHNDAVSDNPISQLDAIKGKHPQAANIMRGLFGGQEALDAYAAKNQTADDLTADKAQSIVSDPKTDKSSPAYQKAVNFLKDTRTQKAQTAADEATAKTAAEAAASPASAGLAVPRGFNPNPNASELSSDDLKTDLTTKGVKLPSNYDALYAVAHNAADLKTLPNNPRKGSNQMSSQEGLAFIRQYMNPQYQEGDYAAASGLSKELASTRQGTAGGSLLSAGVASNHLDLLASAGDALKNYDTQALNGVANKLGVAVGKSPAVTFSAIADQVNSEVGKVVAGGTPHEAELAKLGQNLNTDQSPEQINNVVRAYVNLMSGRVNEINERSQQYFGREVKGVSPETAKVFAKYGVAVPGYVSVKVNGKSGVIPKNKLSDFKKQFPNAEVQ